MGHKIFVSYKHGDGQVKQIPGRVVPQYGITTARSYVDILDVLFTQLGHICKAENSGESLKGRSEEWIASKLAERIYDSTVTVVLISKGMDDGSVEKEQWIPWEVSYSLKENTRGGITSATNAMIAVVLPDENNSYDYFITDHDCWWCKSRTWHTYKIFNILGGNMFNRHEPRLVDCENPSCGKTNIHTGGDHSYIQPIKWDDFTSGYNVNNYVDLALGRQKDGEKIYNIKRMLQ